MTQFSQAFEAACRNELARLEQQREAATRPLDERIAALRRVLGEAGPECGSARAPALPARPGPGSGRRGPKPQLLKHEGEALTVEQWAEKTGVNADTLRCRLKRGWKLARALKPEAKSPGPTGGMLTHQGKTMPLHEWAKEHSIPTHVLRSRIARGWLVERALAEGMHSLPSDRRKAAPPPPVRIPPPQVLPRETVASACPTPRPAGAPAKPREEQVLELARQGRTAREIAEALDIALQTAYVHLASLRRQGSLPALRRENPEATTGAIPQATSTTADGGKAPHKPSQAAKPADPARPQIPTRGADDPQPQTPGAIGADNLAALREEAARQCRKNGTPSGPCVFLTTMAGPRRHVHRAKVDRAGDGWTERDETDHGHDVKRFRVLETDGHGHGLAVA